MSSSGLRVFRSKLASKSPEEDSLCYTDAMQARLRAYLAQYELGSSFVVYSDGRHIDVLAQTGHTNERWRIGGRRIA